MVVFSVSFHFQAKELDAMDEVFGIGELIEENIRATKQAAYTHKDLKGLKVEHDMVIESSLVG